jgi:hypothetical protein
MSPEKVSIKLEKIEDLLGDLLNKLEAMEGEIK